MNHQPHRFLPLLFICISLFSTAFMLNSSAVAVETPPQYNASKMTFFERFMLKRAVKKLEKQTKEPADANKALKDTRISGATSLVCSVLALPFLIFSPILGFSGVMALIIMVILLSIAVIAGINAQFQGQKVLENASTTAIQKKLAQKGKNEGFCGLILGGILLALIWTVLRGSVS